MAKKKEPQFSVELGDSATLTRYSVPAFRVGPKAREIHARMYDLLQEFIAVRVAEEKSAGGLPHGPEGAT